MGNSPLLIASLRAVKGGLAGGWGEGWAFWVWWNHPSQVSGQILPSPLLISLPHPPSYPLHPPSPWEQLGSHWHLQGSLCASGFVHELFIQPSCLSPLPFPPEPTAFTFFQVLHLFFALLQTTPAPKVSGVKGKGLGGKLRNLYLLVFERWNFMLQKMCFFSIKRWYPTFKAK